MLTNFSSKKNNLPKERAQAIVEFAIVLPILLMVLVGILEVGRMIFIYTAVNNASRDAARYASAVGLSDDGTYNKYSYCAGIRNAAKQAAFLTTLTDADIVITYDKGPTFVSSPFDECPAGTTADSSVYITPGDRVTVTISTTYRPMVNLIPIGPRSIVARSSRTILGILQLASDPGGTAAAGGIPTNVTATYVGPTRTPTPTVTKTPTATVTSIVLASATPTFTPTSTPTPTTVVVASFTPTPTPVPGCGNITTEAISMAANSDLISMKITNPHTPFTVTSVQVKWNAATGGRGNKTISLIQAQLGVLFWNGSDSSGNATLVPTSALTLPGNNVTSTLVLTMDKNYQNPVTNGTTITINLSSPACGNISITKTR